MTNRSVRNPDLNKLTEVETCFEKFKGIDVITVNRNGSCSLFNEKFKTTRYACWFWESNVN